MEFNSRIKHKRDTEINWESSNKVLLDGELIIVETSDGYTRLKIGNGTSTYKDLPFTDEIVDEKIEEISSSFFPNTGGTITGDVIVEGASSLNGNTFVSAVFSDVTTVTTNDIDVSKSTLFVKEITGNSVINFVGVPENKASCFTLVLKNGGSKTVLWNSNVKWSEQEVPELTSSGIDILTFLTIDGGATWYGVPSSINAL